MVYRAIPTFNQHSGYVEARRVMHPRLFLAARAGYIRANAFPGRQVYELAAGFRPNRWELVKIGYQAQQGPAIRGASANTLAIQFVTAFRVISVARD
jgi:hypothetical protein